MGELVDLLERTLHVRLRRSLRELETLARRAEAAHAGDVGYPAGLAGRVEVLSIDVFDHMEKEERVVFPAVRRGLRVELTPPIRVMKREHQDILDALTAIGTAARAHTLDDRVDVATGWYAFRDAFEAIDAMLREQIDLEEQFLFSALCGA